MELLELMRRLGELKDTARRGWVVRGVPPERAEDVAQHSFEVCSLSLLLSLELEEGGRRLDVGKVLAMAVVHDWPEAITGDRLPSSPGKREAEERALVKMVGDRAWGRRVVSLWREYAEGRTLEARVVHFADGLSVLLQCLRCGGGRVPSRLEDLWGGVEERLRGLLRGLPELSGLFSQLRELGPPATSRTSSSPTPPPPSPGGRSGGGARGERGAGGRGASPRGEGRGGAGRPSRVQGARPSPPSPGRRRRRPGRTR
ncbi:MAG: HD domain-containing protein [Candidatus Hadarchaeales archaeon]